MALTLATPEFIFLMYGAAKMGITLNILNPFNDENYDSIIARLNPKLLFCYDRFYTKILGRIDNKKTLYRFLLMYTYLDNWDNEINEDYFSTPWSEINWALEKDYDVIYLNSYTLEYKKDAIAKMFDHHMKDITHHQVIYTKKEL